MASVGSFDLASSRASSCIRAVCVASHQFTCTDDLRFEKVHPEPTGLTEIKSPHGAVVS